jgi:hypothetical protein
MIFRQHLRTRVDVKSNPGVDGRELRLYAECHS